MSGRIRVYALVLSGLGVAAALYYLVEGFLATRRVQPSELMFERMSLQPDEHNPLAYGLDGRIRNLSKRHVVNAVTFSVVLRDCPTEIDYSSSPWSKLPVAASTTGNPRCDILGEADTTVQTNMPPGQARDISEVVRFSPGIKIRGNMQWHYTVKAISAK
jgi:hypothetical protein